MSNWLNGCNKSQSLISYKLLISFTILLVLLKTGPAAFTVVSILLCLWALTGIKQAIQALSIAVVIKHLNPMLYSFSAEFGVISWALLLLAGMRIFLAASLQQLKMILPLLVFALTVALLTAAQANNNPDISAMKLFIFTYGAATLIVGYEQLNDEDAEKLTGWFMTLITTVILLSLPTFAFPGIAYAVNGHAFQGIMSHPQAFGPMLAPIASWLLAGLLFSKGSKLIKPLLIAIFLLALMIRSEARTSIVAVFLSLGTTFLVLFFKRKRFQTFRISRTLGLSLAAVAVLGIGAASSSALREHLHGFVFKHHSKNMEEALSSRSSGVESQWDYFLHEPVIGNGFGVYAWGGFPSGVVRVFGIPISAPVEKGFLPTAILEEIGLIGTLAFLFFLITFVNQAVKNGNPRWLAVFFACVFVNMGEMVFFSLGGIGLYYWLLMGLSTRSFKQADQEESKFHPAIPASRTLNDGLLPVRQSSLVP
ncbi:MAG: O-antigen ligase family protein [Methylococcaceae bacterium]|nr:O-antigen ligase family protein [Methylococcaceae bacterium]